MLDHLFHWNQELQRSERVDRVQEYKGHQIESITWYWDCDDPCEIRNHRSYRITYPDGSVGEIGMNKGSGNIAAVKDMIDYDLVRKVQGDAVVA